MISLQKWMILAHLQKLTNNVGNLVKIIVATGFELLPKVQKIALSGHTDCGFIVDYRREFSQMLLAVTSLGVVDVKIVLFLNPQNSGFYWGSPIPHFSQQHEGLQHAAVFQPRQEVTCLKERFKSTYSRSLRWIGEQLNAKNCIACLKRPKINY